MYPPTHGPAAPPTPIQPKITPFIAPKWRPVNKSDAPTKIVWACRPAPNPNPIAYAYNIQGFESSLIRVKTNTEPIARIQPRTNVGSLPTLSEIEALICPMTSEMPKKGESSLHMMYQTCGTQINLDYTSEKDFVKKFKLSSFLVPISVAIFANSSIVKNKDSGYLSYRSKVWQHTARAGLPKYFLEDMNFEKYADMAMKMPLLFVLKDSNYLNAAGKTFKDFVEGNLSIVNNAKPTIRDFKTHLATIFTEVRLKQYIEIRSLDTCEWDCHCGAPAFYVGLLYASLDEAYDIISKWNISEVLNAYIDAPKKGLNTLIENKTILEWGKIFLSLSRKGLEKRSIKNDAGKDESIFLRSVESILTNEKTKAEITIEKFQKNKNLDFLYEKKE